MSAVSIPTIALLLLILVLGYTYIIDPLFISPLSKIPSAHPLASITPAWITWIRYRCKENATIHDAHERLGPVVRLDPNEVSVNCYEGGLKTVYSGNFEKHDFYPRLFTNYGGILNIFSTAQNKPHGARKRMVSNVYSKSFLQSSASMAAISQQLIYKRLLPKVRQLASPTPDTGSNYPYTCVASPPTTSKAQANEKEGSDKGGTVEVHALFAGITMDFVTAYLFGLCRSSNFIEDEETSHWWCRNFLDRRPYTFWSAELPGVIDAMDKWFAWLPWSIIPKWVNKANRKLDAWALSMCDLTQETLRKAGGEKGLTVETLETLENEPTVYRQHFNAMATTLAAYPATIGIVPSTTANTKAADLLRMSVASDMHDHLAAGQETSNITFTYLFHEIAVHQDIQLALRKELSTLSPQIRLSSFNSANSSFLDKPSSGNDDATTLPPLPSPKSIDALPLLNAIILETLRLHAAIPGPQPRITPASGTTIGPDPAQQYHLPPNVRISSNAHSLHRIASVFPDPETWSPYRWLEKTELGSEEEKQEEKRRLREMHNHFWAFSSGGHMCLGNHLAVQTIKLVTAALVTGFCVELLDAEDGQGRKLRGQEDAYTAQPSDGKVVLRLREVEKAGL